MRTTQRFGIREVNRGHPIWIVKPTDFTLEESGCPIDPEAVWVDPRYTLYCFDPENEQALFVEVDDPVAVDRAAFYYQGQVEHAVGVVAMPLSIFHRVGFGEKPLPVIWVHSVGRCGSTLLSKALQAVPTVHSLSEPDDLTQLVTLRQTAISEEWVRDAVRSSVRWRGKPRFGTPAERIAIKTRSEVLVLADLIGAEFPSAKHLFLYRDAVSWMGSLFRGYPVTRDPYDPELNRKSAQSWAGTLPILSEYIRDEAPLNAVEIRTLAWITCMEGYMKLVEFGVPTCAARFEDLTKSPIPVLQQAFSFCDIGPVDWSTIGDVLERDSQAGTIYDREERKNLTRELTAELAQDVRDLIAGRSLLGSSDVVVPNTVRV